MAVRAVNGGELVALINMHTHNLENVIRVLAEDFPNTPLPDPRPDEDSYIRVAVLRACHAALKHEGF